MDKNTFGATLVANLLIEGEKMNKVAGWVGTKLGEGYKVARNATAPYIGVGLQKTGEQIAIQGRKAATGVVRLGGKVGKAIDDKTLALGRKTFYKGMNLREKYKKQ